MKRIALLFLLCASAFAQRQNPLWTIVGAGASVPGSCSGHTIFIYTTDGSYRYCNGSSFVNPFSGISGIGSLNGLTDATQTFARTNDTNVTLTITSSSPAHTFALGWTGTLAAGRLNANVVQGVTNDTNVTGSISAQNLTIGWTGTLAKARQNSATVYNDAANTWSTGLQDLGAATLKIPSGAGFTAGSSSMFGYDSTGKNFHGYLNAADAIIPGFASAPTNGHCLQASVASGNVLLSDAGAACGTGAGTPPFSAITAGTNAAALLVGTGGSLGTSGTGTIAATSVTNLTLANTLTTSGNFPLTLTTTASTSVTLPTSGTLAILGANTFTGAQIFNSDIADLSGNVSLGNLTITAGGNSFANLSANMSMRASYQISWSSTTAASGTLDLGLSRNAAGVVEVTNGTAGTFRDLKLRTLLTGYIGPTAFTGSGTAAFLDATATTGATLQNVGYDGSGTFTGAHTSATTTQTRIVAGQSQGSTQLWRVDNNSGTAQTFVDASYDLTISGQKATTGTRYACFDTAGKLTSSASACSGT